MNENKIYTYIQYIRLYRNIWNLSILMKVTLSLYLPIMREFARE